MGQRGRKSTAALSVVAGTDIDGRPKPPEDLNEFQRGVWERTVANEAKEVFGTEALKQLLKEYCRHVDMANWLERQIQESRAGCELDDLSKLVRMRDCETKALSDKATKLRLTNQSRYTPGAAGTAAKNPNAGKKPWHSVG